MKKILAWVTIITFALFGIAFVHIQIGQLDKTILFIVIILISQVASYKLFGVQVPVESKQLDIINEKLENEETLTNKELKDIVQNSLASLDMGQKLATKAAANLDPSQKAKLAQLYKESAISVSGFYCMLHAVVIAFTIVLVYTKFSIETCATLSILIVSLIDKYKCNTLTKIINSLYIKTVGTIKTQQEKLSNTPSDNNYPHSDSADTHNYNNISISIQAKPKRHRNNNKH